MKRTFHKFKLRDEIDKIKMLHYLHFPLVILAFSIEQFSDSFSFGSFIKLLVILLFYKMFFKTVQKFYYTYWTFAGLLAIYIAYGISKSILIYNMPTVFIVYLIAATALIIESYLLYSPIFFPMVNWWEYDFRYRSDVPISVNSETLSMVEGRLTDVRRGAGCVVLFEHLDVGTSISIKINNTFGGSSNEFEGEIMSRRRYSTGRGYNYGVKFKLDNTSVSEHYSNFMAFWRQDRKEKTRKKFKQDEQPIN